MTNFFRRIVLLAILPNSCCFGQDNNIKFGHSWQLSVNLNVGMYKSQISFVNDLQEPILNNDKSSGMLYRPEIEVRCPIGLVIGLGYQHTQIKIDRSNLLEDLQEANPAFGISESNFSIRSYQSVVTPEIGWRFQFVERAYVQPYCQFVTGEYISTKALYTFVPNDGTSTFTREYMKVVYKLGGIGFGLDILTNQKGLTSARGGLWYGISLGWSRLKSSGKF